MNYLINQEHKQNTKIERGSIKMIYVHTRVSKFYSQMNNYSTTTQFLDHKLEFLTHKSIY